MKAKVHWKMIMDNIKHYDRIFFKLHFEVKDSVQVYIAFIEVKQREQISGQL